MLQQPSEFMMYRKLPLDLNKHTLDLNSCQQDFNDIGLLQAQRAAAHALFFEACTTTGPIPSPNWGIHGMYDPVLQHHHHQQQQQHHQYFNPMASVAAAGFWQQQARNCWFPNWQELFQGFLVAQEGQQKQAIAAGFQQQQQQQGAVAGAQQPHPDAPLPRSGAQSLHPGAHAAAQPPHPGAQLLHATAQLPHPAVQSAHAEKIKSEDNQISCSDLKGPSSPTRGPFAKYTIESPPWLPQGWITEVQTRRTGTTAGTRDKYYKDLVSGRRFRSRNEVYHFLETGKGRVRKRYKRRKAIASSSAVHTALHSFAHKTHTLEAAKAPPSLPACQPVGFLLGSFVNKHPSHVGFSLPPVPAVAEEMEPPCKPPAAFPASSSQPAIMLGLKRSPARERAHKLPVKKKAKTESPKKVVDKQASRLWQWLQKPAARNDEQPQKPEVQKPNANAASFEKAASEMADQRTVEELGRGIQAAQRTVQLGREIQAAQMTVMQLGKEMQATVEKLGRELQAAQRDVELDSKEKLCTGVHTAQRDVASSSETKAVQKSVKSGREMQAALWTNDATGNVIQAAQGIDGAMGNVMQAAQCPVVAMGNVMQAAQCPVVAMGNVIQAPQRLDVAMGTVPQAGEWPVTMGNVIQAAPRPDVAMGNVSQAAQRLDFAMGNVTQAGQRPDFAMRYVIQGAQSPDVAMGSPLQAAQRPDVAMGSPLQAAQKPVVAMSTVTQAAQRPDLMPNIAMGNVTQAAQRHVIAMGHVAQAAHMPVVAMGHVIQASQMPVVAIAMGNVVQRAGGAVINVTHATQLNVVKLGTEMQAAQRAVEVKKQMVEAKTRHRDKKYSVLNPKLDLSRLSPNLTSRQRAKVVQRMKARHAKGLLAILGRQLCYKALREGRYRHGLNA